MPMDANAARHANAARLLLSDAALFPPSRLGLSTSYSPMPMDASAAEVWDGVANRYWHLPVYFIPTCVLDGGQQQQEGEEGEEGEGEQQQQEQQGKGGQCSRRQRHQTGDA